MRRTPAHLVAAVAGTVVLAGCGSSGGYGSSGSSSSGSSGSTGSTGSTGGGPVTIGTASGAGGTYLTGDQGRAVYLFEADTSGTSTCSGPCAEAWPPVLTSGTATASGSATAADLGTAQRSDGTTQVTYQGHPLYYFLRDTKAGDTQGQGSTAFGAHWWLVTPDGTALTTGTSSSGSAAPSTSSGGYGGGYGGGGY